MDQRFRTATVKLIGAAAVIMVAGAATAQDAEPNGQSADPQAGTSVFGSQELPKGLTIVPWKKGDPGQLTSGPTRQVEEPLEPIDPEEFRRRQKYYQQSGAE